MWLNGWNYIVGWVRQESVATTALVQAFIALGIAFSWWHWSPAQTGTVVGITAALLGMFARSQVQPLHPLKARIGPPGPDGPWRRGRGSARDGRSGRDDGSRGGSRDIGGARGVDEANGTGGTRGTGGASGTAGDQRDAGRPAGPAGQAAHADL